MPRSTKPRKRTGRRPEPTQGPPGRVAGQVVTTVRLERPQWAWLRERALQRALDRGGRADASEVIRDLIAKAMSKT